MVDITSVNNRFHIVGIEEQGFPKDKKEKITGIDGYHGFFQNIYAFILEKIFHKTVHVKTAKGTYYFRCDSFKDWLKRVNPSMDEATLKKECHNPKWVQKTIDQLITNKKDKKEPQPNIETTPGTKIEPKQITSEEAQKKPDEQHKDIKKEKIEPSSSEPDKENVTKLAEDNKQPDSTSAKTLSAEEIKSQQQEEIKKQHNEIILLIKNSIQDGKVDSLKTFIDRYRENMPKLLDPMNKGAEDGLGYNYAPLNEAIACASPFHKPESKEWKKQTLELLLKEGADINGRDYKHGSLEIAIKNGRAKDVDFIKFLIEKGADINKQKTWEQFKNEPNALTLVKLAKQEHCPPEVYIDL